jgi:hypothetical protein
VDKIVEIGTARQYSLTQAQEMLPLIYSITEKAHSQVRHLMTQIEAMKNVPQTRLQMMETEIQTHIDNWQKKIQKLGAHPKGYWLVDFDNGHGYFCWKFPEKEIKYHHGYKEGFTGRKEIELSPQN